MFTQLRLETAVPALIVDRAERTLRIPRPRTLLAAVLLVALFALTAGGPLFVVSGAPSLDLVGAAATIR
jgi:hypothetical protein